MEIDMKFVIKIDKCITAAIICFFILLKPRYFDFISVLDNLFDMGIILITLSLFIIYYCSFTKKSKVINLVVIYHIYLILITLFNKGDIKSIIKDACIFIGLSILVDIMIKNRPCDLIKVLLAILEIEVIVNLLTIILVPEGLYETIYFKNNFFLGYDNQNINIVLPCLIFAYLHHAYTCSVFTRINLLFVIIVTGITEIMIWSGASLVILVIVNVVMLFNLYDNVRFFNAKNYLIINIEAFILMVLLKLQRIFEFLIVGILGKNLTLSGRIYIWDRTITLILQNPLFGYGVEYNEGRASKYALRTLYHTSSKLASFAGLHAHNRFLETTYRGGIILLVIYIFILFVAFKSLKRNEKTNCAKVIAIGLFAYLMGMLTEFYRLSYLFFPMMVIAERASVLDYKLNWSKINETNSKKV